MLTSQRSNCYTYAWQCYFKDSVRENEWPFKIMVFAEKLAGKTEMSIGRLSCMYDGERSILRNEYDYAYTSKNKEKLRNLAEERTVSSLDLFKPVPRKNGLMAGYLEFSVGMSLVKPNQSPGAFWVYCRFDAILSASSGCLFDFSVQLVRQAMSFADMDYGMVHIIDNRKLPQYYFAGWENEYLNSEETMDARLWAHRKRDNDRFVRSVFLGNLWTRNHVKGDFETSDVMREVRSVVPLENIVQLDDQRVFFFLPLDMSVERKLGKRLNRLQSKLVKKLKKHNILMKDVFRDQVKRLDF